MLLEDVYYKQLSDWEKQVSANVVGTITISTTQRFSWKGLLHNIMHISISSLGYAGPYISQMSNLNPAWGIELFPEWGSRDFWRAQLPNILEGRKGVFSLHAPFQCVNVSDPDVQDSDVYNVIMEPLFQMKVYRPSHYVVHPHERLPSGLSVNKLAIFRETVLRRMEHLCLLVNEQGVILVMENMGAGNGCEPLFSQQQFLEVFEALPALHCVLDIGHAKIAGYDVLALQKTLGNRILAYHLHDNDGINDSHQPIGTGCVDWARFCVGYLLNSQEVTLVFEYANTRSNRRYAQDVQKLSELMARVRNRGV